MAIASHFTKSEQCILWKIISNSADQSQKYVIYLKYSRPLEVICSSTTLSTPYLNPS